MSFFRQSTYTTFLLITVLLSACAQIENPLEIEPYQNIKQLSPEVLCRNYTNNRYKQSPKVVNALRAKGYRDCSSGEIFCMYKLRLIPGTKEYSRCRLKEETNAIAASAVAQKRQEAWQKNWNRMFTQKQEVYVHHSYWPY